MSEEVINGETVTFRMTAAAVDLQNTLQRRATRVRTCLRAAGEQLDALVQQVEASADAIERIADEVLVQASIFGASGLIPLAEELRAEAEALRRAVS